MSERYRLEPASLGEDWDRFVKASSDGTLFALSGYLEHVDARLALYWCLRRDERRACVLLAEDGLHDHVIYSGLIHGAPTNKQNRAQRLSEQHEIAEFVAA